MQATRKALHSALNVGRREIGPVGTAVRLLVAVAALVLPATLDEFSGWDLLVGLAALPVLATAGFAVVRAGYERYAVGGLASQSGSCCGASTWLTAVVLAGVIPLAALTAATFTAFWLWIGASLVLAAVRGYGGCEILAFPNTLTGRHDEVGCILFTSIDQAEARGRFFRSPASLRGS